MKRKARVVICGAGIAGIAAAYWLAVKNGVQDVVLVDARPPISLTSDKSTECYRNWWPGPDDAMIRLMNRSIELIEELADESENVFHLNRRGYLYASADLARIPEFLRTAEQASSLGAGPLRIHSGGEASQDYVPPVSSGYKDLPDGADLILDRELIRTHFPYLATDVAALLHVRRAGWFSGQQLGKYLLDRAIQSGVRLLRARVKGVGIARGRIETIHLEGSATQEILTNCFVNAAGPFIEQVAEMAGVRLPVFSELHLKVSFQDLLEAVPSFAPLLIWTDPQHLLFTDDERAFLREDENTLWLLERFPAGLHARPEGGLGSKTVLALWPYHTPSVQPVFPIQVDNSYAEVVVRGLARMLPKMSHYLGRLPKPYIDGGYYTKTRENRPVIGPLPVEGVFILGALSGFGLMAACGAAELLSSYILGNDLPLYAQAFTYHRFSDPYYLDRITGWEETGQL